MLFKTSGGISKLAGPERLLDHICPQWQHLAGIHNKKLFNPSIQLFNIAPDLRAEVPSPGLSDWVSTWLSGAACSFDSASDFCERKRSWLSEELPSFSYFSLPSPGQRWTVPKGMTVQTHDK
ncbi:hypothetical protein KIL84_008696 [Mauremys mutica]|uniref:Uncharacterized protein n=1 Tax=Mauremys mutica TaxID=74926 RepID=A0A9D4AZN6_9SAUR|nr:hypothetical protein KIL84_008696 [Mauremys mutica]